MDMNDAKCMIEIANIFENQWMTKYETRRL
jgi:hypothetical protein